MTYRRKGLTLIEVLIILVMIGILSTIVIQKIKGKKPKELTGSLQSDVRNVQVAEDKYFTAHNAYGTYAQLDSAGFFKPAPGNTVTVTITATGFTAASTNSADPVTCTVTVTGSGPTATSSSPVCQ